MTQDELKRLIIEVGSSGGVSGDYRTDDTVYLVIESRPGSDSVVIECIEHVERRLIGYLFLFDQGCRSLDIYKTLDDSEIEMIKEIIEARML